MTGNGNRSGRGRRQRGVARSGRSEAQIARAQRALDLRVNGASWQQIAEEVGFRDPSSAARLVHRYQADLGAELSDELRLIDLERARLLFAKARQRLFQVEQRGGTDSDWVKVFAQALNAAHFHAKVAGNVDRRVEVEVSSTPQEVRDLRDQFIELQALRAVDPVDAEVVEE
ncbi:hypothetical protein [Rhodococcus triatomae]|nr:hypothetical protein G419_16955 [Rhodococcus triatomae BKS 15-14]